MINWLLVIIFIGTILFAAWAIIMVEYVLPARKHRLFEEYYLKPMLEQREKMLRRFNNN